MSEMINNVGNRMVTKARLVNRVLKDWYNGEMKSNLRSNPFYSEFQGMRQMLTAMDIEYSVDYDDNVEQMTAITILGTRFEI